MDEATLEVYTEALCYQTDTAEWAAFMRQTIDTGCLGSRFLPSVPDLLDALREFRGLPALGGEAAQAYDRVLEARTYSPEGGASWNYRSVKTACGPAAAEAFLEAGGHHAFATTWDESKRRERFIAAYTVAARAVPHGRLLPAGRVPIALPAAPDEPAGQLEAEEVLRQVEARASEAGLVRPVSRPAPMTEAEWQARRARALRALAESEGTTLEALLEPAEEVKA